MPYPTNTDLEPTTTITTEYAFGTTLDSTYTNLVQTFTIDTTEYPLDTTPVPLCCFFVHDTISDYYWDIYRTFTTPIPVKKTSVTRFLTPLPNGTSTRFETNVYPTTVNLTTSLFYGCNPLKTASNLAPGPTLISEELSKENGSQIIIAGVTLYV